MISLLAQTPVPVPAEIASWLACAAFVVWIVSLVKKIRTPALSQPLTVRADAECVLKPDYERDQAVIDDRLCKATESRKQLHERLGEHGERLTALEKSERHTEATLANIDMKLTTILQRLPRK